MEINDFRLAVCKIWQRQSMKMERSWTPNNNATVGSADVEIVENKKEYYCEDKGDDNKFNPNPTTTTGIQQYATIRISKYGVDCVVRFLQTLGVSYWYLLTNDWYRGWKCIQDTHRIKWGVMFWWATNISLDHGDIQGLQLTRIYRRFKSHKYNWQMTSQLYTTICAHILWYWYHHSTK